MYSTEFFISQFQKLSTETLLERLATQELTDEARDALTLILAERGYSGDHLEQLLHQSKKDRYLKTGADNLCDNCGKSVFISPFRIEGQRFCSIDCFHTCRVRQAALDVDDARVLRHASHLKAGPCPRCNEAQRNPDMHQAHFIASAIFVVSTSSESRFSCSACANRSNLWAAAYCATLGWWSIVGVFGTPYRIFNNLREIAGRRVTTLPSAQLLEWTRLKLADDHLQSTGGGRYGLRP